MMNLNAYVIEFEADNSYKVCIKAHRCRGKRRIKTVDMSTKWFKCDSYVSDYVFAHCRDMIDLMRRGVGGAR